MVKSKKLVLWDLAEQFLHLAESSRASSLRPAAPPPPAAAAAAAAAPVTSHNHTHNPHNPHNPHNHTHNQQQHDASSSSHAYVAAAVRALEAVLLVNKTGSGAVAAAEDSLTPAEEILTRVRIARVLVAHAAAACLPEAEQHLAKATLLSHQLSESANYLFMIKDLQIAICIRLSNYKQAHHILKQVIADAATQHMPQWYYYFVSQRSEIYMEEGDLKLAHNALVAGIAEATKRGDLEMKATLQLRRASAALRARDYELVEEILQALAEYFDPPPPESPTAADHSSTPPPPSVSPSPLVPPQHLPPQPLANLFFIVRILYKLHSGNRKDAIQLLDSFQKALEAQPPPLSDEQSQAGHQRLDSERSASSASSDGSQSSSHSRVVTFNLHGPSSSSIGGAAVASSATGTFPSDVDALSPSQVHALMLISAAVAWKGLDGPKAVGYLRDALRLCTDELRRPPDRGILAVDHQTDQVWYQEAQAIVLHHQVEALLLAADFDGAEAALARLVEACQRSPPLLARLKPYILFDWGLLRQSRGELKLAMRCYFGVTDSAGPADADLRVMATLCNAFLMLTSGDPALVDLGRQLLEATEREVSATPTLQLAHVKGWSAAVTGVGAFLNGEIKKTKLQYLETLKLSDTLASNQLKMQALTALGTVFLDTDARQAEKMFATAYKLAKKCRCEQMAAVCSRVVEDIVRRKADARRPAAAAAAAGAGAGVGASVGAGGGGRIAH